MVLSLIGILREPLLWTQQHITPTITQALAWLPLGVAAALVAGDLVAAGELHLLYSACTSKLLPGRHCYILTPLLHECQPYEIFEM